MGNVLVVVKLYPEGIEDVDAIEAGLKEIKEGDVREVKREPIAFGLELVRAGIIIPDKTEGAMEALETALKAIKGVKDVEVEGTTLV